MVSEEFRMLRSRVKDDLDWLFIDKSKIVLNCNDEAELIELKFECSRGLFHLITYSESYVHCTVDRYRFVGGQTIVSYWKTAVFKDVVGDVAGSNVRRALILLRSLMESHKSWE